MDRIPSNPDEFSKYIIKGDNYLNDTEPKLRIGSVYV